MNVLKYGGLQENPAKLHETVTVKMKSTGAGSLKTTESLEDSKYILPRIEAIHAGRTRNYNYYPADKLKGDAQIGSGVYSWLNPYPKPVIYNHDTNTEATGRVLSAAYADYTQAGRPGIVLIPKITEPSAVKALQDGRLLTVSIGATSDAAICSICSTDIVNDGYCGHMKGEEYNGQMCEWIAGNIWFDELSWVNVPADSDAMVVDTQSSVFLDAPQESTSKTESAPSTLHEHFGVPKHTGLIVVESKETKKIQAENKEQEENKRMEKEPKTVEETNEIIPEETTIVESPEVTDVATDKEPEPSTGGETPEDTEVKPEADAEPEVPAVKEPEDEEVETPKTEESAEIARLQLATEGLQTQVEALTKELKSLYVERIVEKSAIAEDKKELFVEKLNKRSIDSLKDRLEDIQEGFDLNTPVQVEEKPARQVTKVVSPIPGQESVEKKSISSTEKVSFYKNLLSK